MRNSAITTVRLPPYLYTALKELAAKRRQSLNSMFVELVSAASGVPATTLEARVQRLEMQLRAMQ
jgi:predicted transcriptional regulator